MHRLCGFILPRPALEPAPGKGAYPAWVMNAMGGIPATIAPTILTAGKTISGTFLDLLTKPELVAEAKQEFDERVAADPMPALLPKDFEAPTDLPWPDYSGTADSRHW
jgi:aminobenzoyl-glutamate utilization protein B